MNNCLVTKLDAVVNDNNLRMLDSIYAKLKKPSTYFSATVDNGERVTITRLSGEYETSTGFNGDGTFKLYSLMGNYQEGDEVNVRLGNAHTIQRLGIGFIYSIEDLFAFRTEKTTIDANSESGVYGNIEGLYRLTSLTSLSVNGTSCTGDIKTLAEKMVAAGRTSGNLYVYCNGGGVKCDGVTVNSKKIVFDSSVTGGYTLTNT